MVTPVQILPISQLFLFASSQRTPLRCSSASCRRRSNPLTRYAPAMLEGLSLSSAAIAISAILVSIAAVQLSSMFKNKFPLPGKVSRSFLLSHAQWAGNPPATRGSMRLTRSTCRSLRPLAERPHRRRVARAGPVVRVPAHFKGRQCHDRLPEPGQTGCCSGRDGGAWKWQ